MVFCDWPLLLGILFFRFTHVEVCISTSFLFIAKNIPLYEYTKSSFTLLKHIWVVSSLESLYKKAAMNIHVNT